MPYPLLRTEYGEDFGIFKVRRDYRINKRNDAEIRLAVMEMEDAVNVIAVTPDQKVVMVKQFRFGTGVITTEIPGGMADHPEESLEEAAQRELREETGFTGEKWTYLGSYPANPVMMSGYIHHFCVEGAIQTTEQELDEAEDAHIELIPLSAIRAFLSTGHTHPHTISAFFLYWEKRKTLG